ncbi:MAG: hypothetical protein QXI58_05880, partial [Candidatus Micrarchaeia archaeon]
MADGEEHYLYLDVNKMSNSNNHTLWTRKQRKWYHRLKSFFQLLIPRNYQILFLTLTSPPDYSDKSKKRKTKQRPVTYNFEKLKQQIEREWGFRGIQHLAISTNEGNSTLHVLLAWKPQDGMKWRHFWIPHSWLSERWENLHGARDVYISKVNCTRASIRRLINYLVDNMDRVLDPEMGNGNRISWSWKRMFGFPPIAVWKWINAYCFSRKMGLRTAVRL